jgi:thiamine-monophosphate kinase
MSAGKSPEMRDGSGGGGRGAREYPELQSELGPGREFDLIRSFLRQSAHPRPAGETVGPGDDCAVVVGERIAISCDMSVEGVHFRREWLSPEEIGWRATSAALSDLAAVAARPIGVLASCALPDADAGEFAVRLMTGVRAAAERAGGGILGGDLTRSPGPLVLDVTVIGEARSPILRSGARAGDEVWVTGSLGGSSYAVATLLENRRPPPEARIRFARPSPRIGEALWLLERIALTSLIDISDGLAGDVGHVAAASGVAIVLDRTTIPVDPCLPAASLSPEERLRYALTGGEDYELCLTAAPGALMASRGAFEAEFGIALSRVGRVEAGRGVFWGNPDRGRTPLDIGGFQHFRESH